MGRYNITSKGYKFDKLIFWGIALLLVSVVGVMIYQQGTGFTPYFKCKTEYCLNPFYSGDYSCTWGLGTQECKINHQPWMDHEILPKGQYGQKPKLTQSNFLLFAVAFFLVGIGLNHFVHNKGRRFHINIMDKNEEDK